MSRTAVRPPLNIHVPVALVALSLLTAGALLARPDARPPAQPPAPKKDTAQPEQPPAPPNPRGEPLLYEANSTLVQPGGVNWWSVAVFPDGKRVVTGQGDGGSKGEVKFWDRESGKVTKTIAEPKGTRCVALSPDGKLLVTGNYDAGLRLYDAETGALLASGDEKSGGHKVTVNGVCFFKTGKHLATAGLDNTVRVWDVSGVKAGADEPATLSPVAVFEGHTQGVLSVAVSDDGLTLLSGSFDRTGRAWDVPDPLPKMGEKPVVVKKERVLLQGHGNAVEAVAVSPDGQLLVTGSWDAQLIARDRDGKKVEFSVRSQNGVMCATFSKDGKYLAVGSGNMSAPGVPGELRVWDVAAKREVSYRNDYPGAVLGVAFTPDNKSVASVGNDRALHLWTYTDPQGRKTHAAEGLSYVQQPLLAGAVSAGGDLLAVANESKTVYVLDRRENKLLTALTAHDDVVAGLAFSPDGKTLATASYDKTVKLWDTATWKERKTLAGHTGWVLGVAFTPDGKTIATGGYDKTVRLWDAESGEAKATWREHTAGVRSVAFDGDGKRLVTAGSDRIVRVWDVAGGNVVHQLKGHKGAVRSVTFSPDGATIASGSEDRTVKLWDAATGNETRSFDGLPDMVTAVRFSPKGQTLAVANFQGNVTIFDPLTGRRRQGLFAHNDAVTAVSFADGGQNLITVSQDRTIRQWPAMKPSSAAASATLPGKPQLVSAAAFTPDGRATILGGFDGSLTRWEIASGAADPLFHTPPKLGQVTHVAASAQLVAVVNHENKVWVLPLAQARDATWTRPGRFAAFTPDGKHVAIADGKDAVLYEAASGKEVRRFVSGHDGPVVRLAFSQDGKRLATAGEDTKVRLWDVDTATRRQDTPPFGNYSSITHLAFSPDGARLAVAAYGPDQPPPDDMTGNFQVIRQVRIFTVPAPDAKAFPANPVVFAPQPQDSPIVGLGWASAQQLVMPASDGTVRTNEVAPGTQPRESRRFRAHDAAVLAFALSPDGATYVTAGEDMAIRRWGAPAVVGQAISARITGPFGGSPVWVAQADPSGRYAYASAAGDKMLQVFPRLPGPSPVELTAPAGTDLSTQLRGAYAAAFSPDGKTLVTGHDLGGLAVWDAKSGRQLSTPPGLKTAVRGVAFTSDGKSFVTVGSIGNKSQEPPEAVVWDAGMRTVRVRLEGQKTAMWSVTISPDDKLVAACCTDGTIPIWDLATGKLVRSLQAHMRGQGARSVAFSPDGKTMVSGGFDNTLRVWDTDTWEQTGQFALPNSRPSTVLVSPDGKEVVCGSRPNVGYPGDSTDCVIYAYRLDDPAAKPRELKGHRGAVLGLTFLKDGKTLVSGGGRDPDFGEVLAWDFASGKVIGEFRGLRNWVEVVAASPDGETVVSVGWGGGRPGEQRLWNVAGFRSAVKVPTIKTSYIACADTTPDGKTLVLGASSGGVVAFDMTDPANPKKVKAVEGKHTNIRSLLFDPTGKRFVTGDEAGKVIVWDAARLEPIAEWQASTDLAVYRARFTPDGKSVVTCAGKWNDKARGEIRVWDPATGKETGRFPDQSREVWDFVFLDGGKTLVSAQAVAGRQGDAPLKVWDFEAKTQKRAVTAIAGIRCMAVSPDGKLVAAANHTGQVKVLDAATWEEVLTPPEHGKVVFRLGFSPDGKTLYSASEDGTVGVTRMPPRK